MKSKDLKDELARLSSSCGPGMASSSANFVRFVADCPIGALLVLERVVSVLRVIVEQSILGWSEDASWSSLLPGPFVDSCAPKMSQDESSKWLVSWSSLPLEERVKVEAERKWSLDDWLYWMSPSIRHWSWNGCEVDAAQHKITVVVAVDSWPFPTGALKWLLRASGASRVSCLEEE